MCGEAMSKVEGSRGVKGSGGAMCKDHRWGGDRVCFGGWDIAGDAFD
jgi:hypothetical protein